MPWSKEFKTALYSLDGVGPVTYQQCLKALRQSELTEAEFWVNKAEIWQKIALNKKTVQSIKKFTKEHNSSSYFESLAAKDIRVIFPQDKEFPPLLKRVENFPPLLFARGGKLTGDESYIAAVGTRSMTDYGQRAVTELIPPLVRFGKTIVSGFMYGVDVAAQSAALAAKGKTVGILGFGFDSMYPPEQQPLFEEFLAQGATFLSPFAPHVPAVRGNFPARNALVAGMSEGVLVIEAALQSGSLITAGYAAEFSREVWVVSGSMLSRFSEGTKELVNQGAKLVCSAADIVGSSSAGGKHRSARWMSLTGMKRQICELLFLESLPLDTLAEKLQQSIPQLSAALVELELFGLVEQTGNTWSLKA